MDKKKTHKRSKPKRAMESDSSNNTTTTQDDDIPQSSGKKTIRIAGVQLNATSTDTLTTKDIGEEQGGSSSSGHSLHRSSSGVEKTKHVCFEDLSEKSGSTSSQSKSSESSLRSSKSITAAAEGGGSGGITIPTVSKTILRKRKKNAKRRAKKIACQAMSAIQMDESAAAVTKKAADASEISEPTQETAKITLTNEPKLRFSDEVLQIAERPIPAREGANTSSARQLQQEMADGTFVPENIEIAARFKQIMDMFDNFTKNLESLELPQSPRDEFDGQALTKKMHTKSAIPLGWKGDNISCNVGSNIDISITENADREKEENITGDIMKETLVGQTAVKDIKVAALPKAELREAAVLPTIPQKCEIRDWQTGVLQSVVKEYENKINMQNIQDPKTLQNIAKEKMVQNTDVKKENFQETPTRDISIHEISAKQPAQNAEGTKVQEISFKVPAAPAMVEIKIVPEAPKITDATVLSATTTMQTDQLEHKSAQVRVCNKDFEVDQKSKQTKVETISNDSAPEKIIISSDCSKAPKSVVVNDSTDFVIEMEGNEYPEKGKYSKVAHKI